MKLSENIINILKNFAQVNNGIIIKKGNILHTSNVGGEKSTGILIRAELDENFEIPNEAPIYDIMQFLNVLKLFNNPEVTFEDSFLQISDDNHTCKYMYANKNVISVPPTDHFDIGNDFVEFTITWKELSNVLQAAQVLRCDTISINIDNGKVNISTKDNAGVIQSGFNFSTNTDNVKNANIDIGIEFMKLMQGDYIIRIPLNGRAAEFSSNSIKYWIAARRSSKY